MLDSSEEDNTRVVSPLSLAVTTWARCCCAPSGSPACLQTAARDLGSVGVCFYLVRLKSPRAEAQAESFNLSRARWYHGEMQETFLECQLRKLPGILAIEV